MMRWNGVMLFAGAGAMVLVGCSRSNNLLLGRVETQVGTHTIVVTDCYRTNVPGPPKPETSAEGKITYRYSPCRDADIVIRGEELIVNGRSYGSIKEHDSVTVDHGKVLINDRPAL